MTVYAFKGRRLRHGVLGLAAVLVVTLAAGVPAVPLGADDGVPQGRGAGGGAAAAVTPADPARVASGRLVFMQNCVFCHGADARGGAEGGSDLTRSAVVAADHDGVDLGAFLKAGRPEKRMPPFSLPEGQVSDLAVFLHSLAVPAGRGGRGGAISVDIVGDAAAGQAFFTGAGRCSGCHSVTGDLKGIGTRLGAYALQARIVLPRGTGGYPGAGVTVLDPPSSVTVKEASGKTTSGTLLDISDFVVTLRDASGQRLTFLRNGDVPAVEVRDPLQGHLDLMPRLTDANIHDLAAYLLTVR